MTDNGITGPQTNISEVEVGRLVPADWNFKVEATPEQLQKLANSIEKDRSAGVFAVRELPDGSLEVMDGNHRLAAIRHAGWSTVYVENFGPISLAEAVLIARRRNYQWFDTDFVELANLVQNVVLPEYPVEDMIEFMPESLEELQALADLAEKWEWPDEWDGEVDDSDIEALVSFSVIFDKSEKVLFQQAVDAVSKKKDLGNIDNPARLKGMVIGELAFQYLNEED